MSIEKKSKRLDKFTEIVFLFAEFSIVGWIYEVVLAFLYGYGFVNRGFLFGPFLPVYGFGGILIVSLVGGLVKKKKRSTPVLVFLAVAGLATAIELGAGLLIDVLLEERLWDYTDYSFNYKGLISLNTSVRFGLGGLLILYVLLPFFNHLTNRFPQKRQYQLSVVLFVYLLGDFLWTLFSNR